MKSAVAVILLLACGQSLTQEYNLFFRDPQQPSLPVPNPASEQLPYGEKFTKIYQETSQQHTEQKSVVKQNLEEEQDFSENDYYYQPNQPIQATNLVQPPILIETATPDPYQSICPCKPIAECPRQYGIGIYDVRDFGAIAPCQEYGLVRCCGNPLPTPEPAYETLKYTAPADYAKPTQDGKDSYQNEVYNEPETPVEVHGNQGYAPAHDETSYQPTKVEMISYPPGTLEETEGQHTATNYEQTGTVQQENQQSYDTYTSPEQKHGVIAKDEKSYQTQYQASSAENVEIVPITATSKPYNPPTYMKPAQQYSSVKEHSYNHYSIETPVLPPSMPGQSPMHVKFEIPQHKTQYPTKPDYGFRPVPKYSTPLLKPEYSPTMQPTMVPVPVVAPVRVPYQTTSMQIEETTITPPTPVPYVSTETAQSYEHHVQQTQYQQKYSNNEYTNTYQQAQPNFESQNKEGTTTNLLNLPILAPIQEETHGLLPASVSTDIALPVEHRKDEESQGNSPYNTILKQYHEYPTSAPTKYEPIQEETRGFVPAPVSNDIPLPGEHREETESTANYPNKPAAKQYQQYPTSAPSKYEKPATIEYTPTTTVPPCHQNEETIIIPKQETTTEAAYTTVATTRATTNVEYDFEPLTQYRSVSQESYSAPDRIPQPAQSAYVPQPAQPAYVPQPAQPAYVPPTAQPAYVPQPAQPTYVPQPAQPAYVPQPAQPAYVPQPAQPSYAPQTAYVSQHAQEHVPQATKPQTYPAMNKPSHYQAPIQQQQPQYLEPQLNHAAPPPSAAAAPGSSSYRGQVYPAAPATEYVQFPPFATNSGYHAAPAHVQQPAYERPQQAHAYPKNQPSPMPVAHHYVPRASSSYGMSWQQSMAVNQFAKNIRTSY